MLWLIGLLQLALLALCQGLRLHLGLTNEQGSPDPAKPYHLQEPDLMQAVYARFQGDRQADHYTFEAQTGQPVNAMLLIPANSYEKGLRAAFRLYGPGLAEEGVSPALTERKLNILNRDYLLVQHYPQPLPQSGSYWAVVECEAGAGTYAFCIGQSEGRIADADTMARIKTLASLDD